MPNEPIWGLQAAIASDMESIGRIDYATALMLAAAGIVKGESLIDIVSQVLIATYRFANRIGLAADGAARQHLKEQQRR